MVKYNNNIIIYGGCPTSLDRKKRTHISFHPLIFNINTNKLNALHTRDSFIPALRSHHAC